MAVIKSSNIVLSSDIGSVLNAAGGSVNINQPATFFTSAANINPFSKKKPVILEQSFCQDLDSSQPNYIEKWWRDKYWWFGFKPITPNDNVAYFYQNNINWEWNPPTGGSTAPMRLGDFRGYKTDAAPFVRSAKSKGFTVTLNKWTDMADAIYYNFRIWINTDENAITLSDLKGMSSVDMSNLKIVAQLYNIDPITNPSAMYVSKYTSDVITTQEYVEINIDFSGRSLGTYYVLLGLEVAQASTVSLPIPYDDDNYYMFKVILENNPLGNIVASVNKIGSYDYYMNTVTALQDLNNFQPPTSSNPFKVDDRCTIDVEFTLKNTGTSPETFWTASRIFNWGIVHNDTNKTNYTYSGTVISVDGNAFSGSTIDIPSNESVKVVIRFGYGEEMYPSHYPDYESVVQHYITCQLGDVGTAVEINRFGLYLRNMYYNE